jgi:sugar phosphate isomerase/epimerase
MTIGLSTYAYFWQAADRVDDPLTLPDMIARTAELGVEVFQICDFPQVAELDGAELRRLRDLARAAGICLELGTRGVDPGHLARWLDLAGALDVTTVRSMVNTAEHRPSRDEARALLERALPHYEAAGVRIALETYEQVPTAVLTDVVAGIGSPSLGICSDPANCVAALEHPAQVVDRVAPFVLNMHVKDFRFTRQAGWVGFNLVGAPLGEGLLDYDAMVARIDPDPATVNQIVEHWLPWQGDAVTTCETERRWTEHNLSYLRSKQP